MSRSLPKNVDLAAQFDLLADLMELEGADGFRISAYRKAAARIRETPTSVAQLALDGKAKQLQDIGKTIEAKIVEVVADGEIHALTKRKAEVPAEVATYGVTVQKSLSAPLLLLALYSPNNTYDSTFLANYAYINLNDQLTRVPGRRISGYRAQPLADPARPGQPDWDAVNVVVSPSWYDEYVLTVGSVGADGQPSRFTLAGPWVDVAAPGEGVVSLARDGEGLIDAAPGSAEGDSISGTSYAAPVVSGVAALIRARAPQLTARQVMQRIEHTAHHPPAGWDPLVGYGVIDPLAALGAGPGRDPVRAAAPSAPRSVGTGKADPRTRTVAFGGAAVCISVATGALTLSAARLRRRREPVAQD